MNFEYNYESPIGTLRILESDACITDLYLTSECPSIYEPSSLLLQSAKHQLQQYFSGHRKEFDLPISFRGTPFQIKVWSQLQQIAYGQTRTYGEIASLIGSPTASRAVGNANNKNRILILIPCHRVIGSNGNLTGFAAGLDVKRYLLDLERKFNL